MDVLEQAGLAYRQYLNNIVKFVALENRNEAARLR